MLDFWATWCVPCRESEPAMQKIFAEYRDRGLVVLAVNIGEERETIDAYVKKSPFLYPVVLGEGSGILDAYKVTAYPTFVLIQDGKVVAHTIGFRDEAMLRQMIEKAKLPAKP
jgi:thiol-disulfide isomerase/thioredoxin